MVRYIVRRVSGGKIKRFRVSENESKFDLDKYLEERKAAREAQIKQNIMRKWCKPISGISIQFPDIPFDSYWRRRLQETKLIGEIKASKLVKEAERQTKWKIRREPTIFISEYDESAGTPEYFKEENIILVPMRHLQNPKVLEVALAHELREKAYTEKMQQAGFETTGHRYPLSHRFAKRHETEDFKRLGLSPSEYYRKLAAPETEVVPYEKELLPLWERYQLGENGNILRKLRAHGEERGGKTG